MRNGHEFRKTFSAYIIVLLLLSLQLASCATTQESFRIQPEFINIIKTVNNIGVIVPTCTVKDLEIGGNATINKTSSDAARPIMERGVIEGIEKKGFRGHLITDNKDRQAFLKNWFPIAREIKNHFQGGQAQPTVPSSIEGFGEILKKNNVECVLAVEGLEHVSTPARKAMLAARTATIILGFGIVGGSGRTYISYSLFCADGKPMYYDMAVDTTTSISNQDDVASVVTSLTENMMQLTNLSKPSQTASTADIPKQTTINPNVINQPTVYSTEAASMKVNSTNLYLSAPATAAPASDDHVAKLEKLKSIRDRGLITEEEYNSKKKEILDKL